MKLRYFATAALGVTFLAAGFVPARAEILEERLQFNLVPIQYGPGTTRLDGMGLSIAARDENNEINLFDYGDNPAGLLADRDAWSLDARVAHRERVERNPNLSGFDYRGNSYSMLAGYRRPGVQAVAGGLDYFDSSVRQRNAIPSAFQNLQYRFIFNRVVSKLSVGAEFRYATENEDLLNPGMIYYIDHSTSAFTGQVGLSYDVHPWVTIAGLGNLRRATITGQSKADDHLDTFDWRRPSGEAQAQVYVHHPRLQGATIYGRTNGAGEEDLTAGWSQLFVFNPSGVFQRFEREVFTENRDRNQFRSRWQFDLVPNFATLAASFNNQNWTEEIVTSPSRSVLGSRTPVNQHYHTADIGAGGSLILLDQRLFAGLEVHHQAQKFRDRDPIAGYGQDLVMNTVNVGLEYLVYENLAFRTGFGARSEARTDSRDPNQLSGATGSHDATSASFGLGLVPSGGIVQLDAAYSVDLSSGWDIGQNGFSLYARVLF